MDLERGGGAAAVSSVDVVVDAVVGG
jgi:hypothetical protein